MELKGYKERVWKILEDHPNARNNDGTLIAYYLFTFHHHLVVDDVDGQPALKLKNFKNIPPMESITRARRIIQNNDNMFLPTIPAVLKARGLKEKNYRDAEVREAQQMSI